MTTGYNAEVTTSLAEAVTQLEDFLREIDAGNSRIWSSGYSHRDYDVYIPSLAMNAGIPDQSSELRQATAVLADAAWQLVHRGILRPGVKFYRMGSNSDPEGMGFSLTQVGRDWLASPPTPDLRVDDPGHLQTLIGRYGSTFGEPFLTLAREAGRTYQSQCSLATCSLAATAAQSLVRAMHASRRQGQKTVPPTLQSATTDLAAETAQRAIDLLAPLVRMNERITAGEVTRFDQQDAFLALSQLIESARWLHDHWAELSS